LTTPNPPHIRYAASEAQLYIAFDGHATHRASLTAEALFGAFLASAPAQPIAIFDLDACTWVDSTFAGWMIKTRQQLSRAGGRVVLSRCTPTCRGALQTMGLSQLFEFRDVGLPPGMEQVPCPEEGADRATVEFMLEAHQRLADLSPENQRVFARIAAELRRVLESTNS